jgi:hypothetical protein
MPLPTAYTRATLGVFLETELGAVGTALNLIGSDQLDEAVSDVEALLGHPLTEEADVSKVRALGRWRAWLAAEASAAASYDLASGASRLSRSQMADAIRIRLARAETEALAYPEAQRSGAGGVVAVTEIDVGGSPYGTATVCGW